MTLKYCCIISISEISDCSLTGVTEGTPEWPSKDEDSEPTPSIHLPKENRPDTDIVDKYDRVFCKYFGTLFPV